VSVRSGMQGAPSARPWLPGAAVLLATLILALPLLQSPGRLPFGHDTLFAAQSAQGFARALEEGVLYPRWVDDANLGLGAPTFVFYSPLAYYAAGGLAVALGGDVIAGLGWTAVLAALLSGLAFVAAFREHASDTALAAGAALFVLAPYHVLDLYWRFAFAEGVAFAWLPALFLAARRTLEGRGSAGVAGLAVCTAGLVLTHLVTAFLAPLVLAPYALVRLVRSRRWGRGVAAAAGGALGLALAGVYLLPVLAERDAVRIEWVREAPYADYRDRFVLGSWRDLRSHPGRMGPQVNRAAATQALLALAAAACLAPRLRRAASDGAAREGLAQTAVAAWVFALQLPLSAPLWRGLPGLPTVQFPWRFQSFQALSACALLALAVSSLPASGSRRALALRAGALGLAAAACLVVSLSGVGPRGVAFGPEELARPGVRHRVVEEYLPRGAPERADLPRRPPAAATLTGEGTWSVRSWSSHERILQVSSSAGAELRLRTFAYPGWTAWVDGEPVPVRATPERGTLALDVPAGEHVVRLSFEGTPARRAGLATSAAAAVAVAVIGLLALRRRRAS